MMTLKPEFAAMLAANKIPFDEVTRLRIAGFIETKLDGSGRTKEMMRVTYTHPVTKYERVSGLRPGFVTLTVWTDARDKTVTEVPIGEVK